MKIATFSYTMLASVGILFAVLLFEKQSSGTCLEIQTDHIFLNDKMQSGQVMRVRIEKGKFTKIFKDEGIASQSCSNLDLRGLFVVPGLIDAHTHLFSYDRQIVNGWAEALQISAERDKESRIEQAKVNATSMLRHGFVAVRDLGNSGDFLDAQLSARIREWHHRFPNIYYSGPGIAVWPSQIKIPRAPFEYKIIKHESDIDPLLSEYLNYKGTWIKVYLDNSPQDRMMSTDLFLAVVRKAHDKGFRVAVHAEKLFSIERSIRSTVDSIEHFYQPPKNAPLKWTQFVVLTEVPSAGCLSFSQKRQEKSNCEFEAKNQMSRQQWLKRSGAQVVFGSDAVLDFMHGYKNRGEASLASLISWQNAGFSATEALISATRAAGELLAQPIGQIRENFEAHLVVLEKDPTSNLQNLKDIRMIVKDGKIFCSGSEECREN